MKMLLQRFVWGLKFLLGTNRGGRNFPIYPDDVFLVSYPRSGNTWTRFLIANMVWPDDPATFANIETKIPDIYKDTRRELARVKRPRILKTHEYFDPRYKKVIYIVRDPRDVVISYYHFHRKKRVISDNYPLAEYVARFVVGEVDAYGSWMENVASWLATRQRSRDFLLLRFEDMLLDPPRELAKVAAFLGIHRSAEQLARAAELSSADNMRKMESEQMDIWVNTKSTRKDIPFVRSGIAGGWKSSLSPEMVDLIQYSWRQMMVDLGYELASTGSSDANVPAAARWSDISAQVVA